MAGFFNPIEDIIEAKRVYNPEMWQQGPVETTPEGYNIRTVPPPEDIQTMTEDQYQEKLAIAQQENKIRDEALKRQITLDEVTYKSNVSQQGTDFLKEMKGFTPGSPEYIHQRSSLIERLPLAVQHPGVSTSLSYLDKTDTELNGNRTALEKYNAAKVDERSYGELETARKWAAQQGNRVLAQFENELKNNPNLSAINLIANLADAQEEQKAISNLRRNNVPEAEINKFRVPEVDSNKQPTGRTVFDTKKAEDYLKTVPSTSNLNTLLGQRSQLRKARDNYIENGDPIPQDLEDDWELTDQLIKSYRRKTSEKTTGGPSAEITVPPTRPTGGKSTDMLFNKDKTKGSGAGHLQLTTGD